MANIPPEVDSFVGNNTYVDADVFQLWVEGNSASEASMILQQRGALGAPGITGATPEFLLADISDQFRTYIMLEKWLQFPPRLNEQWTFQMDTVTQAMLINTLSPTYKYYALMYYEFEDTVMREILGKKLSSRQRKDLDEVSEKTGVNLRSCRRQFDNAKRIFKTVEELTGGLVQNIRIHFLLSEDLAKKYSTVVFIAGNRFETNKRKLQYLTFKDYYNCAQAMMTYWTSPLTDEANADADVEREFLMELRDLRILLDKEKEHKTLVCQRLKSKVSERIYVEVEHNFKVYSRTLINIAYGLNHSKELKDLFIDLVEKYIEPCKHLQWPSSDMKTFLDVFTDAGTEIDVIKSQPNLKSVFKRYMDGITVCLLAMYHN
ncbi:Acidic fibroblast growth factor intracellular-binding protein [Orchesella cincta]|uniref:Acidic fibroblast growth factor intracellular-binding protein n=1 Tax=Orchesella cincta TaxID=48709 RepID=A0A1D2NGN8_ORCCI|nr:Acidic fibroblast growth factor intracellular-binding protein [Orchesella cincta]